MPMVRCPECGRVADGTACFACGYEWPNAGAAPAGSSATSAAKAPSPAAAPAPPAPRAPPPPAAPDIEDIDLGLDADPGPSLSLLGGGDSPFVTPTPPTPPPSSPSTSNPFAIPRPVTGTFPNPGLAPDLSNLAAEVEASPPDRLDDDLLAGAFLSGASGPAAPPAPAPGRAPAPPNPFATPAPGARPESSFASAPGSSSFAPAKSDGFNPFDSEPAPATVPPPPPLELEAEVPAIEDVSWEDLDQPSAAPHGNGLLADGDTSFDDIELDDEADEPTVDTAHSPAYLAKKANQEPLSERLILLAAELDADGRYDDAALLHEAARALAGHKG